MTPKFAALVDPIFHHVLEKAGGVKPERAVFIDDMKENVEAARKVGLHGIVFTDAKQLRRELEGKSELAVLNADLIVHLRRAQFPSHAPALFRRVWAEQGSTLMYQI